MDHNTKGKCKKRGKSFFLADPLLPLGQRKPYIFIFLNKTIHQVIAVHLPGKIDDKYKNTGSMEENSDDEYKAAGDENANADYEYKSTGDEEENDCDEYKATGDGEENASEQKYLTNQLLSI